MRWLLCFVAPPLAVLLSRRPGLAILNLGLTLLVWVPGVIHALMVVNESKADARAKKQAELISNALKKD